MSAHVAAKATRRERPADGGMVWHDKLNAFECYGCDGFEEVHDRRRRTPDSLALLRELLIVDHTECWQFNDPRMAADARKYRKRKKLRENMERQGSGNRDQGTGLASQRTAWRGR